MNLDFSDADERFRQEVRTFFAQEYPGDLLARAASGAQLTKVEMQRAERALAEKGWLAVNWPVAAGGTGWTVNQKYLFDEELERAGAPNVVPMGLLYVGPVIYTFGTEEQKARWLPGILDSTTFWAQGYSEPGSGSDLASLQCAAVRNGDDYVINGTKIWTSLGHYADWIFCLVRTDNSGRKQEGITFICADMRTPGITVHPIITIDGKHSLNRVEFVDVRVPVANRIGEEGKGWTYANYLLGHERTSYAHVAQKKVQLQAIREAARATGRADDGFSSVVHALEVRLRALEMCVLRTLASVASGEAPGNESSILKILATELAQDITELALWANGGYAAVAFHEALLGDPATQALARAGAGTAAYLGARAQSIYGGANEIQKNIIAKRVLNL